MKIQIERDTLLEALNSASRAVATRAGALPVLSGVHILARGNDVTITGSDLDLTVRVNVMAHTQGEGAVVLRHRRTWPGPTTLRRLYVIEEWSINDLTTRFEVGSPTVQRWLGEAGIQIRAPGASRGRRQRTPPSVEELTALARSFSVRETATRLDVGQATVLRWFANCSPRACNWRLPEECSASCSDGLV